MALLADLATGYIGHCHVAGVRSVPGSGRLPGRDESAFYEYHRPHYERRCSRMAVGRTGEFFKMINATLVDATDLPLWATRRDAQATLPQLLRRLVLAAEARVECIGFRAGEGVQLEGWDGLVEAGPGSAFVPDGVSGWEMGTNRAVKDKADDDYATRSADTLGLDPGRTTFVFVTPRRWRNKAAWAMGKQREGRWKDVRAYDADDLATWLEQTPAVHIWFSMVVGKRPAGVQDLSWYWAGWAGATQPRLSPELVIAGRKSAVDEIQQWLGGQPSALGVQGATRDETVAFLAAVLQQIPEQERERLLARCVSSKTQRLGSNSLCQRRR
jgi:hypothetical protein